MDEVFSPHVLKELSTYRDTVKCFGRDALLLESIRIHDSVGWLKDQNSNSTRIFENIGLVIAIWDAKLKIVSDLLAEKELFE